MEYITDVEQLTPSTDGDDIHNSDFGADFDCEVDSDPMDDSD
jgi:hypothetical protein